MKFKKSIMITLFIVVAFLQACSCSKKEAKNAAESVKETTAIETTMATTVETTEAESTVIEPTTEETTKETIQETQEVVPETIINEMIAPNPFDNEPEFLEGQMQTPVSYRKAKQIVLTHANYNITDVVFLKMIQDYEDGIVKWKINFAVNDHEYDYEVNAMDGSIIKFAVKTISYRQDPYLPPMNIQPSYTPNSIGKPASAINLDTAKNIAVNNAGFKKENVEFTKTEYNIIDGAPCWQIEFTINNLASNYKYTYLINAIDSTIISAWVE